MRILFSLTILICGLLSSLFSIYQVADITTFTVSVEHLSTLFPLSFSIVAMVGYLRKKRSVIDVGVVMSMLTYFFINSMNVPFSVLNVIWIVGFFFLFVGIWIAARSLLWLTSLENSARKGSSEKEVLSFSRSARTYVTYGIFTNLLLAGFLSIMGSLMSAYTSLGRITEGRIETVLMLVFAFLLFLVIYKMIDLLVLEEE